MFSWLRRKIQIEVSDSMHSDLERYIAFLRGGSEREVAFVLVSATLARIGIEKQAREGNSDCEKVVRLLRTGVWNEDTCVVPLYINRLIKSFQSDNEFQSAGACMPWLHAVRCSGAPELRPLGKEMFRQLHRGLPHVKQVACDIPTARIDNLEQECLWLPFGLES